MSYTLLEGTVALVAIGCAVVVGTSIAPYVFEAYRKLIARARDLGRR